MACVVKRLMNDQRSVRGTPDLKGELSSGET